MRSQDLVPIVGILAGVAVVGIVLDPAGRIQATEPQPIALDDWITVADNLPEATRLGLDGTVSVDLTVGEDGSVSACRIARSSGHDVLDEHTCSLMRSRARFRPATDVMGRPMTAVVPLSWTWQVITNTNTAKDGWARAEALFTPMGEQASDCKAFTSGRISNDMESLACFAIVAQAKTILGTLEERPSGPVRAAVVLAVSPNQTIISSVAGPQGGWHQVSYAEAAVAVSPSGMRTDCRMIETQGPAKMIGPICTSAPLFRYVPDTDETGANVATELRHAIAYYVEVPSEN